MYYLSFRFSLINECFARIITCIYKLLKVLDLQETLTLYNLVMCHQNKDYVIDFNVTVITILNNYTNNRVINTMTIHYYFYRDQIDLIKQE